MTNINLDYLYKMSNQIRKNIFIEAYSIRSGHLASSLSCVEIMASLYFGGVLKYDASDPKKDDRDRFILSKGHAALTLYAVLAEAGFISKESLKTFCKLGSNLGTHPKLGEVIGVEATSGALGHGALFAAGVALGAKLNKDELKVYTLVGDGECQEGSMWEMAMFASHNKLNNLTVIIDRNKLQAVSFVEDAVSLNPFKEKWMAFGFDVFELDGHDIAALLTAFNTPTDKPKAIIANTVKGKGVSFMENKPIWHFRFPDKDEELILFSELGLKAEELE